LKFVLSNQQSVDNNKRVKIDDLKSSFEVPTSFLRSSTQHKRTEQKNKRVAIENRKISQSNRKSIEKINWFLNILSESDYFAVQHCCDEKQIDWPKKNLLPLALSTFLGWKIKESEGEKIETMTRTNE